MSGELLRFGGGGAGPTDGEIPLTLALPVGVECRLPPGGGEQEQGEADLGKRVAGRLQAAHVPMLDRDQPGPTLTLDFYTPPGTGTFLAVARLFAMVTFRSDEGIAALWSTSYAMPMNQGPFPELVRSAADALVDAFVEDLREEGWRPEEPA